MGPSNLFSDDSNVCKGGIPKSYSLQVVVDIRAITQPSDPFIQQVLWVHIIDSPFIARYSEHIVHTYRDKTNSWPPKCFKSNWGDKTNM